MKTHSLFTFSALVAVGTLFSGCASSDQVLTNRATQYLGAGGQVISQTNSGQAAPASFDNVSHWDGDGVSGSPRIEIRLPEQRAYFFKGDQLVGVSMVSTGREGFGTPSGNFKIIEKDDDHKSSLYGDYVDASGNVLMREIDTSKDKKPPGAKFDGAPMPHFMRLHGGVGMHAGFIPGYPASHGCIRMPAEMAQVFYNNVALGTPVTVISQ